MGRFPAEQGYALFVAVPVGAEGGQPAHGIGRAGDKACHGVFVAEAGAGGKSVVCVQLRAVVRADGGGEPALGVAGVAFADINGSDTLFSWSLGVGYNFQQGKSPTFVEAKFFGTDQSEANGISVAVGVRF